MGDRAGKDFDRLPLRAMSDVDAMDIRSNDFERAVEVVDVADDTSGRPGDDGECRNVLGDDAPGADESVLADDDVRKNDGAHADAGTRANRRALHAFGANGMGIVRKEDAGSKENVVFDGGELGDVHIAMDANFVAKDTIVVNGGVIPDGAVVANAVAFANDDAVAGFKSGADVDRGIDDTAAADRGIVADNDWIARDGTTGRIAENNAGVDGAIAA